MTESMGCRARQSGWDTDSTSCLCFLNYSSSVNNQFLALSSVFGIYSVSAKMNRTFQFRHLRRSDFNDCMLLQS